MCLENVKNKRAKIASEDIPCFKVLDKWKYPTPHFVTPYQYKKIVLGYTYTSVLDTPDWANRVEQGLHAFLTLEQAKAMCKHEHNRVIVKCIIPKGSKYYIGEFMNNYGMTAITASALKYSHRPLKNPNLI